MHAHLPYPRQALHDWLRKRKADVEERQLDVLSVLIDVVFFSSLSIEEGHPARVAVVYDPGGAKGLARVVDGDSADAHPARAWRVTRLSPQPYNAETLARFARGLEYGQQIVVVGGTRPDKLQIHGIARRVAQTDGGQAWRFAAPRPGVVVFEQNYSELFRYEDGRAVPPSFDVLGEDGRVRSAIGKITRDLGSGSLGYSSTEHAILRLSVRCVVPRLARSSPFLRAFLRRLS